MRHLLKRALIDALTMMVVAGLSLLLLLYVAHGEAQRTYLQFQVGKLAAQGAVIQKSIESFLGPGLPMKQFVGFKAMTDRVIASDGTIAALVAFDAAERPVFSNGRETVPLLERRSGGNESPDGQGIDFREDARLLQVVLPLRNKFERVGHLAISVPRSVVLERIDGAFRALLPILVAVVVGFSLFVAFGAPLLRGRSRRWLQVAYAATFAAMSLGVIATLISLYSDGAQAKTKALANSLGQRLASITQVGVNITEIEGLDQVFADYLRVNPDISDAGLVVDGVVSIHTDSTRIGSRWAADPRSYHFLVDLSRAGGRRIEAVVELKISIVYRQILRSVKNFAALFVASAFMAGLFLQLAGSVKRRRVDSQPHLMDQRAAIDIVKPVFFLAVFAEHLAYAFLPQFMYRLCESAGLPAQAASLLFMSYFLGFAATLIPAGQFAQRVGAKPLMKFGLVLAGGGFVLMMADPGYLAVLVARALSGVGQGMVFIGVQSYVLACAASNRKTQAAAIIVFGYQGGMISGMAIGSLLVSQIGTGGVFALATAVALVMTFYTLAVVPRDMAQLRAESAEIGSVSVLLRDLGRVLFNGEFLRTMLLIGVPAKAVLTGVVVFALPVLMDAAGYAQEDIGQILMLYAGSVIVASIYASRHVDRSGRAEGMLVLGAVFSGLGLVLIALMGWRPLLAHEFGGMLATGVLMAGVVIVGGAHGFINAPVVTHIANSPLAQRVGESAVTATYRFLERIGHVAGPMVMGQLFLVGGRDPVVVGWIGAAVAACGLIFYLQSTYRSFLTGKEVT
jgi:predicted MFS family arabinose efflux permease